MRSEYICNPDNSIHEAQALLEVNKKGFLIVCAQKKVLGIATEGDIRRQLINCMDLYQAIKYNTNFEYITINDQVHDVINKFKNEKINFLPILDDEKSFINIITKKQFHVLMLENIEYHPYYDFTTIDENHLDHEIYSRPWGYYKSTILTKYAQGKVITVYPEGELSLQEHKKREEHWIVVSGKGSVILGESKIDVYPGKYIYVPKGCKHKIINTSKTMELIFMEVQLGEYFGEDDIIRYDDIYGRV